jgi:hypothetical protein
MPVNFKPASRKVFIERKSEKFRWITIHELIVQEHKGARYRVVAHMDTVLDIINRVDREQGRKK